MTGWLAGWRARRRQHNAAVDGDTTAYLNEALPESECRDIAQGLLDVGYTLAGSRPPAVAGRSDHDALTGPADPSTTDTSPADDTQPHRSHAPRQGSRQGDGDSERTAAAGEVTFFMPIPPRRGCAHTPGETDPLPCSGSYADAEHWNHTVYDDHITLIPADPSTTPKHRKAKP